VADRAIEAEMVYGALNQAAVITNEKRANIPFEGSVSDKMRRLMLARIMAFLEHMPQHMPVGEVLDELRSMSDDEDI
jgi:hypothetical protein